MPYTNILLNGISPTHKLCPQPVFFCSNCNSKIQWHLEVITKLNDEQVHSNIHLPSYAGHFDLPTIAEPWLMQQHTRSPRACKQRPQTVEPDAATASRHKLRAGKRDPRHPCGVSPRGGASAISSGGTDGRASPCVRAWNAAARRSPLLEVEEGMLLFSRRHPLRYHPRLREGGASKINLPWTPTCTSGTLAPPPPPPA
jgi:hypothetical protein